MDYAEHIKNVCNIYGIDYENELLPDNRKSGIVTIRYNIIYWLRKNTSLTLQGIGRLLKRDHSTVSHAINTMEQHSIDCIRNPYARDRIFEYEKIDEVLNNMYKGDR